MAKQVYDVIVIGTGAGGGMAIKTLCEAGLKVCALNAGRALNPVNRAATAAIDKIRKTSRRSIPCPAIAWGHPLSLAEGRSISP